MWRDFLTWNRKEQYGILTLLFILLSLLLLLFVSSKTAPNHVDPELQTWVKQVVQYSDSVQSSGESSQAKLFDFDPNTVSLEELKQLGFADYSAHNLIKYREAGGRIQNFEKLMSIYGMDSSHLNKLRSHVIFDNQDSEPGSTSEMSMLPQRSFNIDLNTIEVSKLNEWGVNKSIVEDIEETKQSYFFNKRLKIDELKNYEIKDWEKIKSSLLVSKQSKDVLSDEFEIELNSADTAELALLKGIGKVYAWRIINYRRKLGGFYELSQLQEVEGISPVVLSDNKRNIIIDTALVRKTNINKASLRRMKEHPYMNFYMAKDIIEARKKGKVNLGDLLDKPSFKDANKERIKQYFVN